MSGGYADVGDVRLFYCCEGEGDPILFLHGNGQDHTVFFRYAAAFRARFRVILVDSREHGRSGASEQDGELSIRLMAEDVAGLLDELHVERAILFGYSDGANTALEFSCRYPERTIAVIAANGNALPSGLRFPIPSLLRLGSGLAHLFSLCPVPAVREMANHRLRLNALMLHSPALTAARLKKIKAPVLLLTGTLDMVRLSHTKWMARQIPRAKLFLLKGGTHDMLFRHERECMRAIGRFLRSEKSCSRRRLNWEESI